MTHTLARLRQARTHAQPHNRTLPLPTSLLMSLLLSLVLGACSLTPPLPQAGRIYDAEGRPVTETVLRQRLRASDYVLIGEKHDNPEHHRLEAQLLNWRLAEGGAAVFEMLDDGQDAALATLTREDTLTGMREKLKWPEKGWDWNAYGPLFRVTVQQGELRSGNIARTRIMDIYRRGADALAGDARFASISSIGEGVRSQLLERIFDAHCQQQSRDTLAPMLHIQLAKDASMAAAMSPSPQAGTSRATLIAGGEHVRPDSGVPLHLAARNPAASRLVIQLVEAQADARDISAYVSRHGPADFYWLTSATPAKDYCAGVTGKAAQ